MKITAISFILSFIVFISVAQPNSLIEKRLSGIEPVMEEILKTWKAPAFAVAVVDKNAVIYAKGFGYLDYKNKIPADENTLFAIGSCSKAFTSSVLGILRDKDKLKFNESPRKYIPELNFYNDELNSQVTIKDMMCHRTGLPRHDFSWYLFPTYSKDSLIQRIKYQEPFAELREKWYYNNFMFLAQGVLGEKITGKTWAENVSEMIFKPLGMERSNLSIAELEKSKNIAIGYELKNDSIVKKMDYYHIAGMSPAGSINSSVSEMGNWVITWINGGKYKKEQVIPSAFVNEAMSSQMVINAALPNKENPDLHFATYGYGWMMSSFKGHYMVQHGGNIDGFSANTCFFPGDSVGIIVLTNQNGSAIPTVVRNTIADRILNTERTDWNKNLKEKQDEARKKQQEASKETDSGKQKGTRPSHILQDFIGTYSHPGYGSFELEAKDDSLFASFKLIKIWLKHYHYDVFQPFMFDDKNPIDTTEKSPLRFSFTTNDAGDITSVKAKIEPTLDPIEFKRTPKEVEVDKTTLQKYVGEYDLAGMVAKVYLKDNKKPYLFVPGQPEYTMIATGKHKFSIKNLDGYKLEFVENDKSEITEVLFIQPNGTFKATKK